MKRSLQFITAFLLLSAIGHPLTAQNGSKEKQLAVVKDFVEAYNSQDYSGMRTHFSGIAKLFLSKKKLKKIFMEISGSLGRSRVSTVRYPYEGEIIAKLVSEKDSTEVYYLDFIFTKKNKIIGI